MKSQEHNQESLEEQAKQIESLRKVTTYRILEYPIETIVDKYTKTIKGVSSDQHEDAYTQIYVPWYQREFVWDEKRQSKFIESIFMDLPIPYLFLADIGRDDAFLEIIDGRQRIETLYRFVDNHLILKNLEHLTTLNNFRFKTLADGMQRRFLMNSLRAVRLTSDCDENARKEIFKRLNSGGDPLKPMELRTGSRKRSDIFFELITECSNKQPFKDICPLNDSRKIRNEDKELVLRYFAYCENYTIFKKEVAIFMDNYLKSKGSEKGFTDDEKKKKTKQFLDMCLFVNNNFKYGCRRRQKDNSVPRIRFEAIAVGVTLALIENSQLKAGCTEKICETDWAYDPPDQFSELTRADGSNSKTKLYARIHYVRDKILGRDIDKYKGIETKYVSY